MTKKILISGPESSGKTTLCRQLASHYSCPWRPEYAREYLSQLDRDYTFDDLTIISLAQKDHQEELLANSPSLLFCDTGPEVLYIWSSVKYGKVATAIERELHQDHFDLRLLCYPDLEWEADPLREAPEQENRLALWQRYVDLHQAQGWEYTVINGQGDKRLEQAMAAVALL